MADIKINDINLLKYSYSEITGEDINLLSDEFPKDKYVCFGQYHKNGEPFWVVTMHSFKEKHDCHLELSINLKGLLSSDTFKRMGRIIFDYVFKQANLNRCTVNIRASNVPSQRLAKAWGFVYEGTKRKGYEPPKIEDMQIYGLLKEECRWI